MQYSLLDLLQVDHILTGLDVPDGASAIRSLNETLVATGHTTAAFADDACTRELTFPTGLPTEPFAIGMPHADPDHVLASAVAIATLRAPVEFAQMGSDGSLLLDAHIVFLLAIREREKQVQMIQELMALIQNPALLASLRDAPDPAAALRLVKTPSAA